MLCGGRIVAGVFEAWDIIVWRCRLGFGCEPSKDSGREPSKTLRCVSYGIVGAAKSRREAT